MIDNNKLLDKETLDKIENRLIIICMISFAIGLIIYMIKSGIIEELIMYPHSVIFYLLFIITASVFFGMFISSFLMATILSPVILTKIHNFIFRGR